MANKNENQTDIKRLENDRRTELAAMYMLMNRYPAQAREKIKQSVVESNRKRETASP